MFGKRLAQLRKEKGLSQYELADRMGFSRGQVANYEQGKREPDYETLQKIADFFDVSTDYLLGRRDTYTQAVGRVNRLSEEELEILEEIKKHPVMYHDLKTNPEKKIRQLIKMWKFIKEDLEEEDEDDDIIDD